MCYLGLLQPRLDGGKKVRPSFPWQCLVRYKGKIIFLPKPGLKFYYFIVTLEGVGEMSLARSAQSSSGACLQGHSVSRQSPGGGGGWQGPSALERV